MTEKICGVVVTYNRKKLLIDCLDSLKEQIMPLQGIYIIDNASIDNTPKLLLTNGYIKELPPEEQDSPWEKEFEIINLLNNEPIKIHYVRMHKNIGGAGGFYEGIKRGYKKGYDWLWLMDDDGIPHQKALKAFFIKDIDPNFIYGSSAVFQDLNGITKLCWPILNSERGLITIHDDMKNIMKVHSIPFLGFFINKEAIKKAGFPDKNFFISGDDVNYCQMLKKAGLKIFLIKNSLLFHSEPPNLILKILNKKILYLKLPPWKRYYDTRNRILTALAYYGILDNILKMIPGILLRWSISLLKEEDKFNQSKAYFYGIIHGFMGKKGILWEPGALDTKK